MADIIVSGLTKYFGADCILNRVSFEIREGEKVAVVGRNGAGKTTLLRLMLGRLEADEGYVSFAAGRRVSATDQIPVYPEGVCALDVLQTAFSHLKEMSSELDALAARLAACPGDTAAARRHGELEAAFDRAGGYETEVMLAKMVNGMGFSEDFLARPFEKLSGGEKTRVNMARVMLEAPDILLLDEPTNHLDMEAASWLEEFISSYKGTVLIVSHDRYFLDRTAQRVLEVENHRVESYQGGYTAYRDTKKARMEQQARLYARQEEERRRLAESAAKMHGHGTEKLHKRAFSIEKRLEKLETAERPQTEKVTRALFDSGEEIFTEELLRAKGIGRSFGGRTLFSDLDLTVRNGDRLGIVGKNGTGKTTLLRLLLGLDTPDRGTVIRAPNVRLGYLPQAVHFADESHTLIDTLLYAKKLDPQEVRDRLGAFGFSGEEQKKQVSALSGGEKSRLYLCMLMVDRINFLVLDEPTNHLDIPSREWVEQAVSRFSGTLVFVSHDRYFLTRFANRILTLDEVGEERFFKGGFQAFAARKKPEAPSLPVKEKEDTPGKKAKKIKKEDKFHAKEVAAAGRAIEQTEKKLALLAQEMEENATDPEALMRLSEEKDRLDEQLLAEYACWERLVEQTEQ